MSTLPPETTTPTRAAGEALRVGQDGGQGRGAGTLGHDLLGLEQAGHRRLDLVLADQQHLGDQRLDHRQGEPARLLDGDALRHRRAAEVGREVVQQAIDRGVERGLDADDLDPGLEVPGRDGAAGDQAAATDRHHQHVEVGHRLEQLEPDRTLAGDDGGIVVGVDEGEPLLLLEPAGVGGGVLEPLAVQDDPGTVLAGALDLGQRREARHDDRGRDAQALGMVGDTLGVVAGRHGDDAAGALLRREAGELDQGTAGLERAGVLEVLQLEPDPGPGQARQGRRGDAGGHGDRAGDAAAGLLDGGEGDGHGPSFGASMGNGWTAGATSPGGSRIRPAAGWPRHGPAGSRWPGSRTRSAPRRAPRGCPGRCRGTPRSGRGTRSRPSSRWARPACGSCSP